MSDDLTTTGGRRSEARALIELVHSIIKEQTNSWQSMQSATIATTSALKDQVTELSFAVRELRATIKNEKDDRSKLIAEAAAERAKIEEQAARARAELEVRLAKTELDVAKGTGSEAEARAYATRMAASAGWVKAVLAAGVTAAAAVAAWFGFGGGGGGVP